MQPHRATTLNRRRLSVAVFAVVAMVVTSGIVFASSMQQSAASSPVYYVSTAAGDPDIWSVVPGQKPVRMPWNSRGIPDIDPAISPDGRWMAFSSKRTGDYEIWAVDLQAGSRAKPWQVTKSTATENDPSWSPDGKQVAYVTNRYGPEEIMIAPAEGCGRFTKGCPTRLTVNKDRDLQPAWSPDGRAIAFTSQRSRDPALQIYTMTSSGSSVRRLTSDKAASTQPDWSPDGRSIAFISRRGNDKTPAVYTMSSTGSSQKRISSGSSNDSHPSWSPNGREIAYTSNISRNLNVNRIPAGGGRSSVLAGSKSSESTPAWASSPAAATPTPVPTVTPTPMPTVTPSPAPTPTATPSPSPTPTVTPTATAVASGGNFGADLPALLLGFRIGSVFGNLPDEPDDDWESVSGGQVRLEFGPLLPDSISGHSSPTGLIIDPLVLRGPVVSGDGELHENGAGKFSIDIENVPAASALVESVAIEPMTIHSVDLGSSNDLLLDQFGPGLPDYGTMTITVRRTQSPNGFAEWFGNVTQGQLDRREITLNALRRDGSIGRTWTFFDAIPIAHHLSGDGVDSSSPVAVESIVVVFSRVEFGQPNHPRVVMTEHLNMVINGANPSHDITITGVATNGSDSGSVTYLDVFPVQYVFPQFSASGTGSIHEEIHYRANGYE